MTDFGYQTLVSMKESMGFVFFLCSKCEKVHKKTWQAVTQLGKRVDAIEKRLDDIEKLMKANTQKQEETITKVTAVEKKTAVSSTNVQSSVLSEIQQQEARKTNIVIYNLKESTKRILSYSCIKSAMLQTHENTKTQKHSIAAFISFRYRF